MGYRRDEPEIPAEHRSIGQGIGSIRTREQTAYSLHRRRKPGNAVSVLRRNESSLNACLAQSRHKIPYFKGRESHSGTDKCAHFRGLGQFLQNHIIGRREPYLPDISQCKP